MLKCILFPLFALLFFIGCTSPEISLQLAPLFQDHMVLQQNDTVPIWGTASPGSSISFKSGWGATARTIADTQGNWHLRIKTPSYGGPYKLEFSSPNNQLKLTDVLVGEVWLTSGQSNMEWPMMARIQNQEEEIAMANYPQIRLFSVPRNLNRTNINSASWKVSNPENVVDFNAVGYFFAREIHQKLNIPVGIINSSWGGTDIEAWTSVEQLAKIPSTAKAAQAIIEQGGLMAMGANLQNSNAKIMAANEAYLNHEGVAIPENIPSWMKLTFDDLDFVANDYDDSAWTTFRSNDGKDFLTLENIFQAKGLAQEGVVWFRKSFDLAHPEDFNTLTTTAGIGDFDYTYINGEPIGTGLACCMNRKYNIPKGLLKKTRNILAVRVVNLVGTGGFKGAVNLKGNNQKQRLDTGEWRFKHIAFFLNSYFQKHDLTFEALTKNNAALSATIKKGTAESPNTYGILFDTMITPLLPYGIKGILWYQGENNVENAEEYQELFTAMIIDWRKQWGKNLPFYFTQIAPYAYTPGVKSQRLRDAQRKTLTVENTGMAITLDIGEEDDIHPANKQDVGLRLARLALVNDYGQSQMVATGPLYANKKLYASYIDLNFDSVGTGLMAKDKLLGFEIAGEDNIFYPATAKIIANKVRVTSKKVKYPQRVRYGWQNYFEATLFNKEGLPASSFDTE